MQVYVTIELFQGLLESIQVCKLEGSARRREMEWLDRMGINDASSREAKVGEGTEFHLVETELKR